MRASREDSSVGGEPISELYNAGESAAAILGRADSVEHPRRAGAPAAGAAPDRAPPARGSLPQAAPQNGPRRPQVHRHHRLQRPRPHPRRLCYPRLLGLSCY